MVRSRIFKKFPRTDLQTDRPTDRPSYRQTNLVIEAPRRSLKIPHCQLALFSCKSFMGGHIHSRRLRITLVECLNAPLNYNHQKLHSDLCFCISFIFFIYFKCDNFMWRKVRKFHFVVCAEYHVRILSFVMSAVFSLTFALYMLFV